LQGKVATLISSGY